MCADFEISNKYFDEFFYILLFGNQY